MLYDRMGYVHKILYIEIQRVEVFERTWDEYQEGYPDVDGDTASTAATAAGAPATQPKTNEDDGTHGTGKSECKADELNAKPKQAVAPKTKKKNSEEEGACR